MITIKRGDIMSIKRGTTPVDYQSGIKTIEEKGGELNNQLYNYLFGDIQEDLSKKHGFFIQRLPRDHNKNQTVIKVYERKMKELGLKPKTSEILNMVEHNQTALYLRLCTKNIGSIWTLYYKEFKIVTKIIENKEKYLNKKINRFKVFGIGNKSICLIDSNGNKKYHWYSGIPLRFNGPNAEANGVEVCKALIRIYGE